MPSTFDFHQITVEPRKVQLPAYWSKNNDQMMTKKFHFNFLFLISRNLTATINRLSSLKYNQSILEQTHLDTDTLQKRISKLWTHLGIILFIIKDPEVKKWKKKMEKPALFLFIAVKEPYLRQWSITLFKKRLCKK